MSISIEQMIIDAKRLANRLKEKEALADALTNDTERINYQIESMRQVMNINYVGHFFLLKQKQQKNIKFSYVIVFHCISFKMTLMP